MDKPTMEKPKAEPVKDDFFDKLYRSYWKGLSVDREISTWEPTASGSEDNDSSSEVGSGERKMSMKESDTSGSLKEKRHVMVDESDSSGSVKDKGSVTVDDSWSAEDKVSTGKSDTSSSKEKEPVAVDESWSAEDKVFTGKLDTSSSKEKEPVKVDKSCSESSGSQKEEETAGSANFTEDRSFPTPQISGSETNQYGGTRVDLSNWIAFTVPYVDQEMERIKAKVLDWMKKSEELARRELR